jgi:hypothetical protein
MLPSVWNILQLFQNSASSFILGNAFSIHESERWMLLQGSAISTLKPGKTYICNHEGILKVCCLHTKYMDIKRQKGESFIKSVFLLFREFLRHSYVRGRRDVTSQYPGFTKICGIYVFLNLIFSSRHFVVQRFIQQMAHSACTTDVSP